MSRPDFAGRGLALFALRDGEGEAVEAAAPSTIPLSPVGDVEARDGRFFRLLEADIPAIISRTQADYPDGMPLDLRHDSEGAHVSLDGEFPTGGAAGWWSADTMRVEDFEGKRMLVADVDWTEPGERFVQQRLFRYISPVFIADPETRIVEQFKSAALTNNPALNMPALNEAQTPMPIPESTGGLRPVFGLSKDSTNEELLAAVLEQKAKADKLDEAESKLSQTLGLLDAAKQQLSMANSRVDELELSEASRKAEAFEAKRDAVIDGAVKAGKILPAQKEQYAKLASNDEGLKGLEELFESTPDLGLTKVSEQFNKPPKGTSSKMTDGFDRVEDFAKSFSLMPVQAQRIWDQEKSK